MSLWIPCALGPIAATAVSSSTGRLPVMKTKAPSSAKSFAVANPMPLVPPVISAIIPDNRSMFHPRNEQFGKLPNREGDG
jgi:hypothetical protein